MTAYHEGAKTTKDTKVSLYPCMFLCRVACLFLMLHAASAGAQDTPFTAPSGSRPIVDPDGTYVFNHLPSSNLIFEAQIAPRIVIRDSLGDATRRLLAAVKRPVWGWQLSATPMVRLKRALCPSAVLNPG